MASGYPPPKYTWKNPGGGGIRSYGRYHLEKGTLTIEGVQPSDKGVYTCEASSGDGTTARATSEIVEVYGTAFLLDLLRVYSKLLFSCLELMQKVEKHIAKYCDILI